ncbi:MAG: tRNA pseudouridine(55) synthase TruB [Planctomycetota bacterium]
MDGLINLCKPVGFSSAQALEEVRRITGQRKSGHAGALDLLADGVLVLCLGRATKLVESLMHQPKRYRVTARLDVTSASFDLELPLVSVPGTRPPTRQELLAVLRSFEGVIEQVPPTSSAVKVGGRSAYELTRAGRPPTLAARPVRIDWIVVRGYEWPALEFDMCCGRGTYVRSLIRDLGIRLETGGCLTALRRLAVGPLHVDQAWTLAQLAADPGGALIPLDEARTLLAAAPPTLPRPLEESGSP